jgi:hypothetical protein
MRMYLIYLAYVFIFICSSSQASFEGLSKKTINKPEIVEFSRPCCNFSPHPLLNKVGLFQIANKDDLKIHDFNNDSVKDPIGLVYSCKGGFIDIGHLRDNADWTAKIIYHLPNWLGSGSVIEGRNEGGFKHRNVFFPKLEDHLVSSLSKEDRKKIAIAISYGFATLHEIATGFKVAVSAPQTLIMYERASSFSVEDQYSNLLGAYLGAEAALGKLPFNEGMTLLLNQKLKELNGLDSIKTSLVHQSLEGKWWRKDPLVRFQSVLKRNFGAGDKVIPTLVGENQFCSLDSPDILSVPDKLSNGLSVNDYFRINAELKKNLSKALNKASIGEYTSISQFDFKEIIKKMGFWFESSLR